VSIRKLPNGRWEARIRVEGRHLKKTFTQTPVSVRCDGARYTPHHQRTVMAPAVWDKRRLGKLYKAAAQAAGLPEGTTSHDLRHHYASVLLDAGESVHAVAARIGDRPEMVLGIYGHMMPNREDRTRMAVDAAWQQAQPAGEKAL